MIRKWLLAGIAYLLVVMAAYGIYAVTVQPDSDLPHNETVNH